MLTSDPGLQLLHCNYACAFMVVHIYRPDSLAEQIDFCSDKCHKCSENVRCPTVISSSAYQKSLAQVAQEYPILLLIVLTDDRGGSCGGVLARYACLEIS